MADHASGVELDLLQSRKTDDENETKDSEVRRPAQASESLSPQTQPDSRELESEAANVPTRRADSTPHGGEATSPAQTQEQLPSDNRIYLRRWHRYYLSIPTIHTFATTIEASSNRVRDHFALERTFLAYIRTADVLALHAITVGQLFVIHDGQTVVGKTCASIMIIGAIALSLVGSWRYWQQCRGFLSVPTGDPTTGEAGALSRGRALTATPFVWANAVIVGFVCCGLFVVILVVA